MSDSVRSHRQQPTRLPLPWYSPGKITGAGCHLLLQGNFLTQDLNWGLLHCRLGEGNGTPLQHSCLENPMDGGAWWAAVHGVARSQAQLSDFTFTFMHWRRKWQPTPVFLPGESQGWGAWWAAVYGVAQSRTRLKRLSSSSSTYLIRLYLEDLV